MWKAIAAAGLQPAAIAEALARGVADLLGDVGGVLHHLPDGKWEAVVYGPAGLSRREVEIPAAGHAQDQAPWLQIPPGDLGGCTVAAMDVQGKPWGVLAVARLRRGEPDDAFTPEEAALARQLADVVAPTVASALLHQRVSSVIGATEGLEYWRKAYLDDCPSCIFLKNHEGRYIFINKGFEYLAKLPREKILDMEDEEIFPAEQAAFFRSIDRQIIASGKPVITTDKFFIAGEWKVLLACKFPVRDAQGKVVGVGGHVTPVPDAKTSAEALARGEEQLNFVTDALSEMMAYIDVDQRFRFVNRAYDRWFGMDRNDIIGKPMREIFGEATYQQMAPHLEEAFAGRGKQFELKLSRSDGVVRDVRVNVATQLGFARQVEGMVVLITDITEQKLSEERLRFLGDAGGLFAASLDDGTTRDGSPLKTIATLSVPRLADWCAVEMRGPNAKDKVQQLAAAHLELNKVEAVQKLHQWLVADDSPLNVPEVLETGRAQLFEEITDQQLAEAVPNPEALQLLRTVGLRSAIVAPITTRNGTIGALVLAASPSRRRYDQSDLTHAQELVRRVALAVDNADLYAQQQEAIMLRDNFLATASHELRTPLTSLGLHLDSLMIETNILAREKPEVARFQDSLNRAMHHSERLGGLIRQLLDVARMRDGNQLRIEREIVDLKRVVSEVVERFSEVAARNQCPLRAELPPGPAVGNWDASRLDQIATNLVGNALKYGAGKPVQVTVSATPERATLTVTDHGIGIKAEDQERIFRKFERAVSERHYAGMGLGLWITRQAVEAMGGTIRVQSTPGVETTFTVELPLDDDQA